MTVHTRFEELSCTASLGWRADHIPAETHLRAAGDRNFGKQNKQNVRTKGCLRYKTYEGDEKAASLDLLENDT